MPKGFFKNGESITKNKTRHLKPSDIDNYQFEISISHPADYTNTKVTFNTYGNKDAVLNHIQNQLAYYHYNFFLPIIETPTSVKYSSQIHPKQFLKGCNNAILKGKNNIKGELLDRSVLSLFSTEGVKESYQLSNKVCTYDYLKSRLSNEGLKRLESIEYVSKMSEKEREDMMQLLQSQGIGGK